MPLGPPLQDEKPEQGTQHLLGHGGHTDLYHAWMGRDTALDLASEEAGNKAPGITLPELPCPARSHYAAEEVQAWPGRQAWKSTPWGGPLVPNFSFPSRQKLHDGEQLGTPTWVSRVAEASPQV